MIINRQHRVAVAMSPLRQFLKSVEKELGLLKGSVTVCLVSERAIADLNGRFRGKHGPTDVLSFPLNGQKIASRASKPGRRGDAANPFLPDRAVLDSLGDIAISPEVARRNALRIGRSLVDEVRILILHGTLHLLGYDHETDRGQMDRRERALRRRLGLA